MHKVAPKIESVNWLINFGDQNTIRKPIVFPYCSLLPWLGQSHCLTAAEGPPVVGSSKPNVLLIGIDDPNDWVGCLGGHPQAQTPHLDALAKRGVLFHNAHCQSPVCNPSRASMMTSLYPESNGIYFLNPPIASSPVAKASLTLPKRLEQEAYHVTAAGKLFHSRENTLYFKHYAGSKGGFGPSPKKKISQPHGHPLWDWGAFPDANDKDARPSTRGVGRRGTKIARIQSTKEIVTKLRSREETSLPLGNGKK